MHNPLQSLVSKIKDLDPYYQTDDFCLYHQDSLTLMGLLPDHCIDTIFADPPYMLSNDGFTCKNGKMVSVNKGSWDESQGFDNDLEFHQNWISQCHRILKPDGTIWISGTYHSIYQCGFLLQQLGFHLLNDISWFKPNASPNLSCRFFTASHETILWAKKSKKAKHTFHYQAMKEGDFPKDKLKNPGKQMRSVWSIATPGASEKTFGKHPTQKPLRLLKRILQASTNQGDLIFDPFNGAGTTGIVATQLQNRYYLGCDIEPTYLELTQKRYQAL